MHFSTTLGILGLLGVVLATVASCHRAEVGSPPTPAPPTRQALSLAECTELDARASSEERAFVEANNKCGKDSECANVGYRLCEHSTAYEFLVASATAAYAALATTSKICQAYVEGRCAEKIVKPVASAADPGPPKCKAGRCGATNY
jgi:hypothetical protein